MTYVYVIGACDEFQKIGITVGLRGRLDTLQTGHPSDLSIRFSVDVAQAAEVEKYAHWLLRDKHHRGEWFRVTPKEAEQAIERARAAVQSGERAPFGAPARGYERAARVAERLWPGEISSQRPNVLSIADAELRREMNAQAYRRLVAPPPREWQKPRAFRKGIK